MRVLRSRWGRWMLAALVGVVAVGVFVHFDEHVVTLTVTHAASTGDTRLLVGASCGPPSSVEVSEGATTVRVRVRDKVQRWGGTYSKCLTMTCVRLAQPLGSRTVVDDATGKPVRVERAAPEFGPTHCITPGVLST
ncbi:MAG TPA: hypothetical protein VFW74_15015 [Acidimicrobiia bacterium]|nr:hypothetical protein [Acidimicrobiia bacterium]